MYLEDPVRLQFELSNVCNLNCIGCVRTDENFIGSKVSITSPEYVSKETFEKIIQAPEFKNVEFLEFCGSIDDPAAHPEFLELMKIIINFAINLNKKFTIQIHTNGSIRNTEFWRELGLLLKENEHVVDHSVMFNIDGLEDTNHVYRRGSNWLKIMENSQAIIDAGGNVTWQYIVFPWNEHQVKEAHELSIKKSFKKFFTRQNRAPEKLKQWSNNSKVKVYFEQIVDINENLKYISKENSLQIECPTQKDNMYFIDYKSRVWPCCFIPGAFIIDHDKTQHLTNRLFTRYDDSTWNDCKLHSISDIINHRFYQEDLVDSWESDNHDVQNKDRIYVCSENCNNSRLTEIPMGNKTIKTINEHVDMKENND
jgi:MoaA/NifB/PqqE/SkfB family radical SAM enzyme